MEYQKNPIKAIRKHCLECMGYMASEVPLCSSPNCNLYPFRMGKNPYRDTSKIKGNPEALKAYMESKKHVAST